jgi:SAM-dependent methyltransferase
MLEAALQYLRCPACKGELSVRADRTRAGEVEEGALRCGGCGAEYPVTRGVPRLLRDTADAFNVETVRRFEWQWRRFNQAQLELAPRLRELFLEWVRPLQRESFTGKVVLDAGCGMGRWTLQAAGMRAKDVVALDLGGSVDIAYANTAHLDNVHVVQGDIMELPVAPVFDVICCIGVLHHMPDPGAAFASLARMLAPGGTISAWVYGRENNGWLLATVDRLRSTVTSRLPGRVLYALSTALSAGVYAATHWVYAGERGERLPYGEYMRYLGNYGFDTINNIVFDQLTPGIAHYLPREEVERWLADADFAESGLIHRNGNSWLLWGTRQGAAVGAASLSRGSGAGVTAAGAVSPAVAAGARVPRGG